MSPWTIVATIVSIITIAAIATVVMVPSTSSPTATGGSGTATGGTVTTMSTIATTVETSTSCPAGSWPSQVSTSYQPVVQQIEQNATFTALANGRCYSLASYSSGEVKGQSLVTLIFNQYNGSIWYPCGTWPLNFTLSQIQVNIFNGTTVNQIGSMSVENNWRALDVSTCPAVLPPALVRSVLITPPYTPPGPTVQVTLQAPLFAGRQPITNLTAVLALTGREPFQSQTQTFDFSSVNSSNPLVAGQSVSQSETIIGPVAIYSNYIYAMNISGTLQNGSSFSYPVQVEIQNSPSSGSISTTTSISSSNSTATSVNAALPSALLRTIPSIPRPTLAYHLRCVRENPGFYPQKA